MCVRGTGRPNDAVIAMEDYIQLCASTGYFQSRPMYLMLRAHFSPFDNAVLIFISLLLQYLSSWALGCHEDCQN